MLKKLTIQNYALIESLDIEFPQGLVVITGETGAGKSILLGAISLLLGGKFDNAALRQDKNCVVEGEFDLDGVDYILRRVVSPSGRSRFFVNDTPAMVSDFVSISSRLIDIHAQHTHLLLNDKDFQLKVLDGFCDNKQLLDEYNQLYTQIQKIKNSINEIQSKIEKNDSEREYKEYQLSKLSGVTLDKNHFEELEQIQSQLANAEDIKLHLTSAIDSIESESYSTSQKIKEAFYHLEKCESYLPQLSTLKERLQSIKIEIDDIVDEIEKVSNSIEISPERLISIEQELSQIYSLMKRYQCDDIEQLIEYKEQLESELNGAENLEEDLCDLKKSLKEKEIQIEKISNKLSVSRKKGAPILAKTIQQQIRNLELPDGRFEVRVDTLSYLSESGVDDVSFLFAANPQEQLSDIKKVASGGELSRLMLAIKKLMGEYTNMPTIFFDEIDVGVSGKIADKMGELLDQMGHTMQIFAITHLPQVASKGNAHLLIYKEIQSDGRAVSKAKFISDNDRVLEIARLLSGKKTTDQAIANAKVLLAK